MSSVPESYDCVVIGGGPAGLSAALNLARARKRVLVVDSNRPRNAATMISHGFLTRDGVPPHELRRLAREELAQYPSIEVLQRVSVRAVRVLGLSGSLGAAGLAGSADSAAAVGDGDALSGSSSPSASIVFAPAAERPHRFEVEITGATPAAGRVVQSRSIVVATGLRETLPALPSIRAYYGMSLFSCVACDGYEQVDLPLALIGETDDLLERALLVAQWTSELTVFTNGVAPLSVADEAVLAAHGIRLDRRVIDDLEGERGALSAVRMADGERVPVTGGFVRPLWHPVVDFLDGLALHTDDDGHLATDRDGRTSVPGIYAAGDVAAPGPQQLIVAAGAGARVAAIITHDLLGVTTAH